MLETGVPCRPKTSPRPRADLQCEAEDGGSATLPPQARALAKGFLLVVDIAMVPIVGLSEGLGGFGHWSSKHHVGCARRRKVAQQNRAS